MPHFGMPVEHGGRYYVHAPSPIKKTSSNDAVLLDIHRGQKEPFMSKARFRIVVAGRRWGKTHWVCIELIKAAMMKAKQRVWYVAPTYSMAKQIAWEKLKEIIPREWLSKPPNETSLTIVLINGSRISLKGADRPDTLRGVGIHFLALDEYQDMKPEIWTAVRPTLTDTRGRAIFIGTPKSFNHLYEMYDRGQGANPQWASWQYRTADSPFIAPSEIESAKTDMDAKTFRQEYEASFEAMSGLVYYDFDRRLNVRPCPLDRSRPLYVGQDFNIDPMSSVIMQIHGDEVWATGELSLRSSSTEDVCRALLEDYGNQMVEQGTIYPDPAGNSRQHARGESDISIMRDWGFRRILFKPKAPAVRDRLASVNRLICDAAGKRRLYVDPSCKELINCFEKLIYKPGTNEPDKSLNIDHMGDAAGYFCDYEFPVKRKFKPIGYSR